MLFNALLVLSGHKDQQAATRAHERSHGTHKGIGAVLSGHKGTRAATRHSQEHTSAHTTLTRAYERSHGTPWKILLSCAAIRKGTGLIRKGTCRTESDCKRTASTNKSNVTTKTVLFGQLSGSERFAPISIRKGTGRFRKGTWRSTCAETTPIRNASNSELLCTNWH